MTPLLIHPAQSKNARRALGLTQAQLAEQAGASLSYIKRFETGRESGGPKFQQKLIDFFTSQKINLDDVTDEVMSSKAPHPRLAVGTVCFFPIRPDLDEASVRSVMQELDRNDERIVKLFAMEATRAPAFVGEGEYSEETQAAGRELFALCAANYMLVRYLTGADNPLARRSDKNSLGALLLEAMREGIERAGIEIATSPVEAPEEAPEEVEA